MQPFPAHLPCQQHRQHTARVSTVTATPCRQPKHITHPLLCNTLAHVWHTMCVLSNTHSLSSFPLISPVPLDNQPGLQSLLLQIQVPLLHRHKMLYKHKINTCSARCQKTHPHCLPQPCHSTCLQLLYSLFLDAFCFHAVAWTRNKFSSVSFIFLCFYLWGKNVPKKQIYKEKTVCLSAVPTHGKLVVRSFSVPDRNLLLTFLGR